MTQAGGRKQTKLGKWEKKLLPWLIRKQTPKMRPEVMRGVHQAAVLGLVPGVWPELRGVKWSPKEFLGRRPTPTESMSLSRALGDLEEAGLIKRTYNRGKRKRASHIKLTKEGVAQSWRYLKGGELEILTLFLSAHSQMQKPTEFDNNSTQNDA